MVSSADGPVTRDEHIDVVRHALEQPQRSEVVIDRVSGVQVEHRNQDIRKHVAGDENAALLDQQRRMARGMRLMLDNANFGAIPGNLRSFGGQSGNEAEQVQGYLLGNVRRQRLGDAGLPTCVRQQNSDGSRAAGRTVTGRFAELGVPEQVIPMRMRREACHHGLAPLAKVVREGGHFGALYSEVDEQHAGPALHDNGVALDELALVDQHTLRDLPQHGAPPACGLQSLVETVVPSLINVSVLYSQPATIAIIVQEFARVIIYLYSRYICRPYYRRLGAWSY